jgi:hypothetical protein
VSWFVILALMEAGVDVDGKGSNAGAPGRSGGPLVDGARRLLELSSDVHAATVAATPLECSALDMAARAGAQEAVLLLLGAMSGAARASVPRPGAPCS